MGVSMEYFDGDSHNEYEHKHKHHKHTFSMFLTDLTRLSSSLSVAAGVGVVENARTAELEPLTATRALEAAVLSMIEESSWVGVDC